jgi:hypothetical protein
MHIATHLAAFAFEVSRHSLKADGRVMETWSQSYEVLATLGTDRPLLQ